MSLGAIVFIVSIALFVVAIVLDLAMGSVFFWIKTAPRNRGAYIKRHPFGKPPRT